MANKEIKTTIVALAVSIALVIGSSFLISGLRAKAKSYAGSAQAHASQKAELPESVQPLDRTAKLNVLSKTYIFKADGRSPRDYDWNYKTDNRNIKVKCVYNYDTNRYTFRISGTAQGINHLTLRFKNAENRWISRTLTLTVDAQKNIMRLS